MSTACVSAPRSLQLPKLFLRIMTKGRIARSASLLSNGTSYSSRNVRRSSRCRRNRLINRLASLNSHAVTINSSRRAVNRTRRDLYSSAGIPSRFLSRIASPNKRRNFLANAGQCGPGRPYLSTVFKSRRKWTRQVCLLAQTIALLAPKSR